MLFGKIAYELRVLAYVFDEVEQLRKLKKRYKKLDEFVMEARIHQWTGPDVDAAVNEWCELSTIFDKSKRPKA